MQRKTSFLIFILMFVAAAAAAALHPTNKLSDQSGVVELETMIPEQFGSWHKVAQASNQIIDPQQAQTIARIYSQTLSRTYMNEQGYRIMLSIAYGDDQRDSVQLHYPEVCYPAQGFRLSQKRRGMLDTALGNIKVTRLLTSLGPRKEPVTYWATVGNEVVQGGVDKKLTEMQYGLRGIIPDGLLFRVSSIDSDSERAFAAQQKFVNDLLGDIDPNSRLRLSGLSLNEG